MSAAIDQVASLPGRPVIAYDLGPVPVPAQDSAQTRPAATATEGATGTVKPEYARAGQWKAQAGPSERPAAGAAATE